METPPSSNPRNFLYGRQGRLDSRISSVANQFQQLRSDIKLNSKYLQKKQLFPSASKGETLNKMLLDLRKTASKVDDSNWMFQQGETPQFLHNFSIHGL